jgi:hypothetical protein
MGFRAAWSVERGRRSRVGFRWFPSRRGAHRAGAGARAGGPALAPAERETRSTRVRAAVRMPPVRHTGGVDETA